MRLLRRRRLAVGALVFSVLAFCAVGAAWRWWPEQVAPGLTPAMVRTIGHWEGSITLIDGGSRRDAHALWVRFHDRAPRGQPPQTPRLLGISLAQVRTATSPGEGTYWVIYSDRVWSDSFGPDASAGGFGREVILVDVQSLRVRSSIQF